MQHCIFSFLGCFCHLGLFRIFWAIYTIPYLFWFGRGELETFHTISRLHFCLFLLRCSLAIKCFWPNTDCKTCFNTDESTDSNPQTLLFSATLPHWVHDTARKYLRPHRKHLDLVCDDNVKTSKTVRVGSAESLKFTFARAVHLHRLWVEFVYEGHRVKIKVTEAKKVKNSYSCNVELCSVINFTTREGACVIVLVVSVCMYVRQTITFESLDVGSSYLHMLCISTVCGLSSYMKVIWSRSRSEKPKRLKMPILAM